MAGQLDDKVAVITGAGSGIGRATAIEMAARGAEAVVVSDVDDEGGTETAELVREAGGNADYVHCDLRQPDEIRALMDTTGERYGRIDVLHNNAGLQETAFSDDTSVDKLPEEIWEAVYEVNLRAPWLCTKYAVPHLRKSDAASIVNCGSAAAIVAFPMSPAYATTKGGVVMLTKSTALDLAEYGIRCNCYCPSGTDTPMLSKYYDQADDKEAIMRVLSGSHLIPRLGKPEEIAKLICFLASDDASFITGSVYVIDGGMLAWRGARA